MENYYVFTKWQREASDPVPGRSLSNAPAKLEWVKEWAIVTDNHDGTWHVDYESTDYWLTNYGRDVSEEEAKDIIREMRARRMSIPPQCKGQFKIHVITPEYAKELIDELNRYIDPFTQYIDDWNQQKRAEAFNDKCRGKINRISNAVGLTV